MYTEGLCSVKLADPAEKLSSSAQPAIRAKGSTMNEAEGALRALVAQAKRAATRRSQRPSTAHALLAMLQSGGHTAELLSTNGVSEADLLRAMRVIDAEREQAFDLALEQARKYAQSLGEQDADGRHLLWVLTRDRRCSAHRCLEAMGAGIEGVRQGLVDVLQSKAAPRSSLARRVVESEQGKSRGAEEALPASRPLLPPPPPVARGNTRVSSAPAPKSRASGRKNTTAGSAPPRPPEGAERYFLAPDAFPLLTAFGRNLSLCAASGTIDPVVGRGEILQQVLDVLARRRSNNPLLLGPPGVGKTAIVEGLALWCVEGRKDVRGFEDCIFVELSAGSLIAGTGVRGALGERVKQLRQEIIAAAGKVIVFFDEIHTLLGGGDSPDDLAQELKAVLARGEFPCIGATTDEEYRRHFERDPALARRFTPIQVCEPSASETLSILRGILPQYQAHHGVRYADDVLEAAVQMSGRYLAERRQPDKAIGLIDLAAARVKRRGGKEVGLNDLAQVVSELAKVPLPRLLMQESERLRTIEQDLGRAVVGQERALTQLAAVLRRCLSTPRPDRPLAALLIAGPSGVGKSACARVLAEMLFPGGGFTQVDMAGYAEAHSVSRLVGAPPGYVGFQSGGKLSEALRARPSQLLLFDDIDKAHPEVWNTLIPLLGEGRLTDGRGRTIDCRQSLVVLTTSGAPFEEEKRKALVGFRGASEEVNEDEAQLRARAEALLPLELRARLDEIILLSPLDAEAQRALVQQWLERLQQRIAETQGLELVWEFALDVYLVEGLQAEARRNARLLLGALERDFETPLAAALVDPRIRRGRKLRVSQVDGDLRFELR